MTITLTFNYVAAHAVTIANFKTNYAETVTAEKGGTFNRQYNFTET